MIVNKKEKKKDNLPNRGLCLSVDNGVKLKESEKKYKYPDLARELKKLWNMKVRVISVVIEALGRVTNGLVKGLEVGNKRTSGDHLNYSISKIGQNSEIPEAARRIADTQTPE